MTNPNHARLNLSTRDERNASIDKTNHELVEAWSHVAHSCFDIIALLIRQSAGKEGLIEAAQRVFESIDAVERALGIPSGQRTVQDVDYH